MKANELMIGDWVFCTYPSINKPVRVAEIRTVSDNELKIVFYDDDIRFVFNVTYMDPIPLTPEILEKNKLLKHDGFELDFSRHHRLKVILLWTDAKGISRPQITFYLPKPQYVHELQHALRLCGIEKEIEL